ncbi:metalloproteinase inhibitor 2-like [Festucalex cinctus]
MSWLGKSFVLPLMLLCLWRLQQDAHACSCFAKHPQQAFCQSDVAIKVKVVRKSRCTSHHITYEIKQLEMFKGPNKDFESIYTAPNFAACGVNLVNGTEYLVIGKQDSNNSLYVTLCDFFQPWADLTSMQKKGLLKHYQMGCDCKITRCNSVPCGSSPAECLWADYLMEKVYKHFACLERSDGACAWYRGGS